jgi:hypothetical protein
MEPLQTMHAATVRERTDRLEAQVLQLNMTIARLQEWQCRVESESHNVYTKLQRSIAEYTAAQYTAVFESSYVTRISNDMTNASSLKAAGNEFSPTGFQEFQNNCSILQQRVKTQIGSFAETAGAQDVLRTMQQELEAIKDSTTVMCTKLMPLLDKVESLGTMERELQKDQTEQTAIINVSPRHEAKTPRGTRPVNPVRICQPRVDLPAIDSWDSTGQIVAVPKVEETDSKGQIVAVPKVEETVKLLILHVKRLERNLEAMKTQIEEDNLSMI